MGADRVYVGPVGAVEVAPAVVEGSGAVARHTRTQASYLLLHTGVVLDTSRDVGPGAVLLKILYSSYLFLI